ncbi:DUF262 domain-containing protein [Nocardia sp. NPDC050193]
MSRRRRSNSHDPEPQVPRLVKLAEQVLDGVVVLPKFQREFVWGPEKTLDLLDSVARNFPIGSILLWQSPERQFASERTVADLDVAEPVHGYPLEYVLDGQQRIASVCGALYWEPGSDPESRWNIGYDLVEETFCQLTTLDGAPPHVLPARLLSDGAACIRYTMRLADAELTDRAEAIFNRFRDYKVPVVTLRDLPVPVVGKIFERINSTHTPLTIVELTRAATWTPEFDLRDEIDTLRGRFAAKNYGTVSDQLLLRCIAAAAGFGFQNDDILGLRQLPEQRMHALVAETGEAAKRAIDFLVTDIRTPTARALPAESQFAVLTEIFRRIPVPISAQRGAISRWFWQTAASNYFGGWKNAQMMADYETVGTFAQGNADLDTTITEPSDKLWTNSQFRTTAAPAKVLGLLLADAGPIDLRSGQRIDTGKALAWQNDKEFHHFFPRAYLKRIGISNHQANVCANLIMLTSATNIFISDQMPSVYLRDIIETEGEDEVRRRLAHSLIDDVAFDAAMRDDYQAFLHARARTLHTRLKLRME